MDRYQLGRWIDAYERAWRTPGTDALQRLFSERAIYQTAPFERPYEGLAAIARMWEAERERPDEVFGMDSEIVAVEGELGVVRVEVRYGNPVAQTYRDLWIVAFDGQRRCHSFEEWPFWPPSSDGRIAGAPERSAD